MEVCVNSVVDQVAGRLLQLLSEFGFPPLSPDKVSASCLLLIVGVLVVKDTSNKALCLFSMPPGASANYLSHSCVVVATAHENTEELVLVGLNSIIFLI